MCHPKTWLMAGSQTCTLKNLTKYWLENFLQYVFVSIIACIFYPPPTNCSCWMLEVLLSWNSRELDSYRCGTPQRLWEVEQTQWTQWRGHSHTHYSIRICAEVAEKSMLTHTQRGERWHHSYQIWSKNETFSSMKATWLQAFRPYTVKLELLSWANSAKWGA